MRALLRDHLAPLPRDILAAVGLLTRIPVPFTRPRPAGAWAWVLVGLGINGAALAAAYVALTAGISVGVVAGLVIAVQATLTGGLHEDGLADCADGFFGGHNPQRRLEIMKDSQIGSFGALALMLAVLMRWAALAALLSAGAWGLVLVAGVLARAPMAAIIALLPNARGSGLSALVGTPPKAAALAGGAIAVVLALGLGGLAGLAMALAAGLAGLGMALLARAKIGGQTGDVCGAAMVLAELAALSVATAWI